MINLKVFSPKEEVLNGEKSVKHSFFYHKTSEIIRDLLNENGIGVMDKKGLLT